LAPGAADPHGQWRECKLDIKNCSPNQLSVMQGENLRILMTLYKKIFNKNQLY